MKAIFFTSVFALAAIAHAADATRAIPLGDAANIALMDEVAGDGAGGWTDQGAENSLSGFPCGTVDFGGVSFDLPDGKGPAAIAFRNSHREGMPTEVTIPLQGLTGGMLYLLSACAWEFSGGQEVAQVTIRHTDGSTQSEPLVYERNTGAWWTPNAFTQAVVPWRGRNGLGLPIGVYLTWLPIADPAKQIEAISIRAANNRGMFILLGMTISDDMSSRVPLSPLWRPEPVSTESWHPLPPLADAGTEPAWAGVDPGFRRECWLAAELSSTVRALAPDAATNLARTLRLLGYTGVRLPSLETLLPPAGGPTTSGIDAGARESLGRLLAALRAEGLGVMLTLGGGRAYGIDDGVAGYRQIKPLLANQILVDARARELMLDTAGASRDLAPFAVSLLSTTMLLGDYDGLFTAPHHNRLLNAWNAWLTKRHTSDSSLLSAWQVPGQQSPLLPAESLARSKVELLNIHDFTPYQERFRRRFAEQLEFLDEFQAAWIAGVLPEIHSLFPGAGIFYPGWMLADRVADFQTRPSSQLDGVEERFPDSRLATGNDGSIFFWNESPFRFASRWYYRPAFNRLAGKPFVAVDRAASWPGDYEFARLLLTMVVAGVQGWEGIIHRDFSLTSPDCLEPGVQGSSFLGNPAFLAVLPLGRSLFLRGDLARAPVVWSRVLDSPASQRDSGFCALPATLQPLLLAGSVEATLDGPPSKDEKLASAIETGSISRVDSPSGQVRCDFGADRLAVATPPTLALAGTGPDTVSAEKASLETRAGYGVCYATALDGQALASSKAILLGAVGRTRNTGQQVDASTDMVGLHERAWRLDKPGQAPVLMEPCGAILTLKGAAEGSWTFQPLNLFGQPVGEPLAPVKAKDGSLRVDFDNARSPLYLLRHEEAR